jgi:hypothetical protein
VNAHHAEEHAGRGPLMLYLAGAAALDASEIGAKAANLALLADAGFPVPPGLVATPAAERRWEAARPLLLDLSLSSWPLRSYPFCSSRQPGANKRLRLLRTDGAGVRGRWNDGPGLWRTSA